MRGQDRKTATVSLLMMLPYSRYFYARFLFTRNPQLCFFLPTGHPKIHYPNNTEYEVFNHSYPVY